jgi:hypothetical protein
MKKSRARAATVCEIPDETLQEKVVGVQVKGTEVLPNISNLTPNPNILTVYSDLIGLLSNNQGMSILSFYSRTAGLNVEVCRVAVNTDGVKQLVNMLCRAADYYPEKKQVEKQ